MILSIIYFIIFVVTILFINKYNNKVFILIFLFLYAQLWSMISCLYIEKGIFVTEEGVFSYFTGATIRLINYNFVFFSILSIMTYFLCKKRKNDIYSCDFVISDLWLYKAILLIIFIIIITLFINMLISGIPLFSHGQITRFNFWSDYAIIKKLNRLQSYLPFYCSLLGCMYIYNNKRNDKIKHISLIIFLLLILYLVLEGNKFTEIFLASYFFLIPIYICIKNINLKFITKKIFFIFTFFFIVIFSLTYIEYKYVLNVNDPINFIFYRIFGLQGHIWWGTDLMVKGGYIDHYQHIKYELSNIIKPDYTSLQTGMKYLMTLVGGNNVQVYINSGVNFTMGYPAIALVTFGEFGTIIFQSILAIILSFIFLHAINSVKLGRLIDASLTLQLIMNFFEFFTMGRFYDLLNIENLIIVLTIFMIKFYYIKERSV